MGRMVLLSGALLFLGCCGEHRGLANAAAEPPFEKTADQQVAEGSAGRAGDPCNRREGHLIVQADYRDCVSLMPPERIRGTWFVGNEDSTFLPEGVGVGSVRIMTDTEQPPEMNTWLDAGWPKQLEYLERVPEPKGIGDTLTYEVEFIGRRARDAGQYGHGGIARHLIVLDEMLSIRPVKKVRTRIQMMGLDCWVDECSEAQARREGRAPG